MRAPLYPRNARESHLHMLAHTGCRAAVVSEKCAPEIEAITPLSPVAATSWWRSSTQWHGLMIRDTPRTCSCADDSHLRCVLVSTAPISDETALKSYEIFGDAMYQGYGHTEILPIAMIGQHCRCLSLSCRSGARTTCPVRSGEMGEIVAKCEGQMRGFWKNQEAMAECIVDGQSGFQRDGNACGSISLETRERTSLISQGEDWRHRSPLDNVIAAHSDVVGVAVFGIPNEEASVTQKELVELCSVHLGNYKRPGEVVLRREPLAKAPVGKIKR